MTSIYVTVGTTPFDTLIRKIDELAVRCPDSLFFCQISKDSIYKPINCDWVDFTSDHDDFIKNADFVITHAGAGNVFSMLERNVSLIVVPNFERIDSHQGDLARFVEKYNYASVCWDMSSLADMLCSQTSKSFGEYRPEPFFGLDLLK